MLLAREHNTVAQSVLEVLLYDLIRFHWFPSQSPRRANRVQLVCFWSDARYLTHFIFPNSVDVTLANRLHSHSVREHAHPSVCTPHLRKSSFERLDDRPFLILKCRYLSLMFKNCNVWSFSLSVLFLYSTSTDATQRNTITDREEAIPWEITSPNSRASLRTKAPVRFTWRARLQEFDCQFQIIS